MFSSEFNIPFVCFLFGVIPLVWCGVQIFHFKSMRYGHKKWLRIVFKAETAQEYRERIDFEVTEKRHNAAELRLRQLSKLSNELFSEVSRELEFAQILADEIERLEQVRVESGLDSLQKLNLQSKINQLASVDIKLAKLQKKKLLVGEQSASCSQEITRLVNERDIQTFKFYFLSKNSRYELLSANSNSDFHSRMFKRMELRVISHEMKVFGVCSSAELEKTHFKAPLSLISIPTNHLKLDELIELFDASELLLEDLSYKLTESRVFQGKLYAFVEAREEKLGRTTKILERMEINTGAEAREIYDCVDTLIDETRSYQMLHHLNENYADSVSNMIYQLMLKQREIAVRIVELKNVENSVQQEAQT